MIIAPSELPIEKYHNCVPEWLSKTSIRDFISHGPKWWKLSYLDNEIARPTPVGAAQGSALDCALTDPEGILAVREQFAFKPEGLSLSTKEGRAWKEDQGQRTILTHEDWLILEDAIVAVVTHPKWPEISRCQSQLTCRRHSPGLGLGIQSRPDWISEDRTTLFDLKKTRDLTRFGKQAIDLGYHLQAAIAGWCLAGDGFGLEHAWLVAVEWERGARCRVLEIPQQALVDGDKQMREVAADIADRIKRNDWSDSVATEQTLEIPDWMLRKMGAVA